MNRLCKFWGRHHATGVTFIPIKPTLIHHPQCVLCGSIEMFTDSLFKGMVMVQKEGGGGERCVMDKKWLQWKWWLHYPRW
jgi:hypothetical protein